MLDLTGMHILNKNKIFYQNATELDNVFLKLEKIYTLQPIGIYIWNKNMDFLNNIIQNAQKLTM